MTNKADRERKAQETHQSLVTALESIKGLLEQSESKLSAARDSIARAHQKSPPRGRSPQEDPLLDIPVLDDIVIPGQEAASIAETLTETITAVSNSINPAAYDREELLSYIDEFQANMEKQMRDSLMKSVVTIETSLKKNLNTELNRLRKHIRNNS